IFHVNWFRQGQDGKYLWPGYGENLRVIQWILERCEGHIPAQESPIGYLPTPGGDFNLKGLTLDQDALGELFGVDRKAWIDEFDNLESFLLDYEPRVPIELKEVLQRVQRELSSRD
ncbi:Phosphoenolpyruvate carboxykinase, GTP-utilizing, partial [mine drainage metagenome]